jgi:hypothetical protein
MKSRRKDFLAGQELSNFVRPSGGRFVINQKSQIFGDRRTKRNRDRSAQKRSAIQDSQGED